MCACTYTLIIDARLNDFAGIQKTILYSSLLEFGEHSFHPQSTSGSGWFKIEF
jgi:hypothetical protein